MRGSNFKSRRGAVAMLAMIYLVLFGTLTVAMYSMATLNTQSASNFSNADHARATAESGLRWIQFRFTRMDRPKTMAGDINPTVANNLWPAIRTSIINDLNTLTKPSERATNFLPGSNRLITSWISSDESTGRFRLEITQDPNARNFLMVSSVGRCGNAERTISMRFKIDKKVRFAIAGKVPIQLGRNVVVEGPVAMTTPNRYPPIYSLSDFRGLNSQLAGKIDSFNSWLKQNHTGYDNRVSDNNGGEWMAATKAGFRDTNGDGFMDEYDLFVSHYDKNRDGAIDTSEFTNPSNGKLYDPDLFTLIDGLGAPMSLDDAPREGFNDGRIDNKDGYAKVRGQVSVMPSESNWKSHLPSGQGIQDQIKGPIASEDGFGGAVDLGVSARELLMLSPSNFDTTYFKNQTGPAAGSIVNTATLKANKILSAADANGGTVNEKTPFGSTSTQATYARPVFKNMTFRNVQIPKGLNALFENCKFEGVTFVSIETNITNSSGQTTTSPSEAMAWSRKMKTGSFSSTTPLTAANSHAYNLGNNLRFNNCAFEGPIASDVPTAYSHFSNSWEFNGTTHFDNKWTDSSQTPTAMMVAPQTNIEMGSFTAPGKTTSTLTGVVVAGNLDIRGSAVVDGAVLITGDGAANTTLGWFGSSDAATSPSAPMPEGGWGKLDIRYNPTRPLPDGINLAVDLVPQPDSYIEGKIALSHELN